MFVALYEKKGMYKLILSGLLKKNQLLLALSKAVQYKNENKELPPQLNVTKLTHKCIQHYIKEPVNEEAVREAIQYLESQSMKIKFLTDAKMIDDILQIYIKCKDYKSAYELVLQHGYYEQGVRIAEEDNSEKMVCLFQLYSCYNTLSNDSPATTEHIQQLASASAKFPLIQAELYLLDAKTHNNKASCENALRIYRKHSYTPGELEAFDVFMTNNVCVSDEVLLKHCQRGNMVLQLFSKGSQEFLPKELEIINQVIEFHHLQKQLRNQYSLPPYLGYWITAPSPVQVKLPYKTVLSNLRTHYEILTKKFLSPKCIEKALSGADSENFDIHQAVLKSCLIPPNFLFPFRNYIDILCIVIELNESFDCLPESPDMLLNVYSPQQVINNYAIIRKNLSVPQNSVTVHKVLERKCKVLFESPNELVSSLDKLFEAWRVSLVARRNVAELQRYLHIHSIEQFKYGHGQRHIFLTWIDFCTAIAASSKLRLIDACFEMWHGLFRAASTYERPLVRESLSDINLIYVLMIQTTMLLGITSYAWNRTFCLPQVFQHSIKTFDLLNAQSRHQRSLLKACNDEISFVHNTTESGRSALLLLQKYLQYLVGCPSSNINILKRSLDGCNEHEIRYCITLIITIAANLYIARPKSDNIEVHNCLDVLFTHLQSLVDKKKYHFLGLVHRRLETTKSVYDLLGLLQFVLPVKHKMRIDNIHIIYYTRSGYIYFEKLKDKVKEIIPDISIIRITADQYLLKRLMNQHLLEPVTAVSPDTKDEDIESAQALNIDLKVEQKDRFAMLKSNMIENNFCNACGMEIEDTAQEELHAMLERQISLSMEEAQDKHIAESNHVLSLRRYAEYNEVNVKAQDILTVVLQEIEKTKFSDDIEVIERSVHCEKRIESLRDDNLENYNWSSMKQILQVQIELLEECLRDLQELNCLEPEDADVISHEDEAILSSFSDYEAKILPNKHKVHKSQ